VSGRYIESPEPLLPGERLAARWSRLAAGSVLAARIADPLRRSRPLTFALDPATRSASLTVAVGGRATFVNGAHRQVIDVPPLAVGDPGGPDAPWSAASPQAAVQSVIDHLDLNGPDDLAWLCAAIEPAERPLFALAVPGATANALLATPAPDLNAPALPGSACRPLLDIFLFGGDSTPVDVGSSGAIVAVRPLRPGQAVVTATITHHFQSSETTNAPPGGSVTVTVPVLATLTTDGFWHVSTLDTLLPDAAPDPGQPSDAELLADRAGEIGLGQGALHKLNRVKSSLQGATTVVGHHPTCGAGRRSVIADPTNDVTDAGSTLDGSTPLARDQRLATVDVRRASLGKDHGRLCLTLTFTHPAPSQAAIRLDLVQTRHPATSIALELGLTTALATRGAHGVHLLVDVRTNRAGHTLSVSLPASATRRLNRRGQIGWRLTVEGPAAYTDGYDDELPNPPGPGGPSYAILRP